MSEEKTVSSQAQSLVGEVADRIKQSGPAVYERLRDTLVEREVRERVDCLDKALQKRQQLSNDLKKASRPDNETFNADGSVAAATYSKAKLEEIKKATEALNKMDNVIEKALTAGDFSKLREMTK